jgi:hypothetical protein
VLFAQTEVLNISWNSNPEPDMYQYWLYRSVNSYANFNFHANIDHPDTTYPDTDNILAGNLYVYCLIAVDSAGNQSEFSDSVRVGIPKIEWSLYSMKNEETTFVSLDSIISDPDHGWQELTPVISNEMNVNVQIDNNRLLLIPNPPGFFGNASFFFELFDPQGFSDGVNIDLNIIQTAPSNIIAQDQVPDNYQLYQNFPNPFNPTTRIKFSLPKTKVVRLNLYNPLGELVETVYSGNLPAGTYEINYNGHHLSSGIYLLQMQTSDYLKTIKLMLAK